MNVSINHYLTKNYLWPHLCIIFVIAFILRAATFGLYVQHEERYRQADTNDYHYCAVGIKAGTGMHRVDSLQPIFWRTPGYPLFLAAFYTWFDIKTADFSSNKNAQKACIWLQILLCSLIPLLIFLLARSLTRSFTIALLAAWISVFHLGFILASCYILSDALGQIFFITFLYFFYQCFLLWFEPRPEKSLWFMLTHAALAALSLGIYTWIRPNGQFIVVISLVILFLGKCSWRIKYSKILLFTLVFFGTIGGWYVRNYQLTNQLFFCPMSGPYLQSFCAPKIIRKVTGKRLEDCMRYLMGFVISQTNEQTAQLAANAPHLKVCRELICTNIALPWIKKYPWYFAADWIKESTKTTFDLYASQLTAMANKTHTYDPLEEFLTEKVAACLFSQPIPLFMRFICWLELIFSLWLWIGLFSGLFIFLIQPLFKKDGSNETRKQQALWLKTGILIGGLIIMTGGFGYARLRLPFDPLLIILSLTFWYYVYTIFITRHQKGIKTNP